MYNRFLLIQIVPEMFLEENCMYKDKLANSSTHSTKECYSYLCQIATIQGRHLNSFNLLAFL